MMKNFSLKQSFFCARAEFIKWVCDARMIILGVLLIFIYSFAIEPLKSNAKLMGEPLNILEPFIAIANSGAILLIIPLVFLTLIADFPKIDTNTVFYIMRVGRLNWLFGQLLKLIFMALSYLAVIFLGAVLPMLSDGFWYNGWSNVATKFVSRFPEHSGNFGVQLLPENLYNQLTVFSAAVQSYLLVFAYLMIIGLILLSFSLVKHKTVGFVLCGAVISLGTAFCSIKTTLMWTMPMANSIIWLHYTKYFREPVMSMSFSVSYLAIFIAVLLLKCICGFIKPTSGEITVDGKQVGKDVDFPKDMGIIIETPGFIPYYSGYKNLKLLAGLNNKIGKDEIKSSMKQVGLDPDLKRHVRKYSLGMRQRLGLAQAIMENPKILILDEPFNGLDKDGVKEMREYLLSYKEQGKTILICSHSAEDISVLCDTVHEMDKGVIEGVR